jgi:hypothetical protein
MSLIEISRPDAVERIRQLADLTGLSIEDAIQKAVFAQLTREREQADRERAIRE